MAVVVAATAEPAWTEREAAELEAGVLAAAERAPGELEAAERTAVELEAAGTEAAAVAVGETAQGWRPNSAGDVAGRWVE